MGVTAIATSITKHSHFFSLITHTHTTHTTGILLGYMRKCLDARN